MATILMRRRCRRIGHVTRPDCENCFTLGARRETQEGPSRDHVATDSGERTQGDGEDLGRHQAYGKGSPDVKKARCCTICHLGVKGMSQ